ncbi:hypothetical protein MTR67_035588 [Solanum verrucosum]|uniref:Uncharacterized protein n=1 Tax=Solanum verrucosum TaxID=315347 RepID=A0AAF0U9X9_SOLVR|nr:hypothetical protein MTR67_035588 [Solanum verrucosum]
MVEVFGSYVDGCNGKSDGEIDSLHSSVDSVEIDREKRWVYIGGDVEPQLLVDYLTQRTVKPNSVKLIYYCSKEATTHHAKNQTPMENNSHVKETYCHMPSDDHAKNNEKREGENYNKHHTRGDYDPNHYAPRKDWVHKPENYVAQPQKQDQYHTSSECRNPSCDFHAWKRQGSTSRFDFDMRSTSARWLREAPPLFYGYNEPIMRPPGQFPYI